MRVAVVGGGLAGIAAAMELAKTSSVSVTLIESKNRLGGRAGSFQAVSTGQTNDQTTQKDIDYCQHVGMGCCHHLKALIQELGHGDFWDTHRQLHFYGPDGKHQKLGALPGLPAPLHIAPWLFQWPGLSLKDRISVARGMFKIRRLRIDEELDAMPAMRWLEAAQQTQNAIQQFWSTIIVSALGEQLDKVSMASVCKVLQDGFLNSRDAYHLIVPNKPLDFLFNESIQTLFESKGIRLRLGERVKEFSKAGAGVLLQTNRGQHEFDRVILAIPWFALSKMSFRAEFDELVAELAPPQRLESSPITGIHTWWDRPWLETPHAVIVGRFCQWVFPKSDEGDLSSNDGKHDGKHYYQIVVSASHALKDDPPSDFASMLHDDLAHVFPAVRNASLQAYKVVTDPNAVFSVTPGVSKLRSKIRPIGGKFAIAGDWTQTGWPSTMEGAIISGKMAVTAILNTTQAT